MAHAEELAGQNASEDYGGWSQATPEQLLDNIEAQKKGEVQGPRPSFYDTFVSVSVLCLSFSFEMSTKL
jgi:hypothetical protein